MLSFHHAHLSDSIMTLIHHLYHPLALATSLVLALTSYGSLAPAADCPSMDELTETSLAAITTTVGDPNIGFQDLRGIECYAQPDQLVVCGPGDTIPVLLFTKSEEPIFDVLLTPTFEEGLEYASFAYVQSGNADLDTVSISNPESPVFRISEISQEGGAVVVYIGISAVCEVDYDTYMPTIEFNLSYESGGVECDDTFTPELPYATNVLVPEIAFTGSPTPNPLSIAMTTMDACVTMNVTNLTPGAPVTEALYTIDNYGFLDGIDLTTVMVNGVSAPVMVDPATGVATLLIDGVATPAYWGADGLLTFSESIPIEVCYSVDDCLDFLLNPQYTIATTCRGESCSDAVDVTTHQFRDLFSGGPSNGTITSTLIQTPEYCDGGTGNAVPYIIEVTFQSNGTVPIKGDVWNLNYRLDSCTSNFLELDSVYFVDGPGGSFLGFVPQASYSQNANGLSFVNFRTLPMGQDADGPGGLDDLDGDGVFDDLPAGESVSFRLELLPTCDASGASCSDQGGMCDFVSNRFNWTYNCGRNGRTIAAPVMDGVDAYVNESTITFDDPDTFFFGTTQFIGYNFGTYGIDPAAPVASSVDVVLTIDPGDMDFASCPGGTGDFLLVLQLSGRNIELANIEFDNAMYEGSAISPDSNIFNLNGVRNVYYNLPEPLGDPSDFSLTMTLDTAICASTDLLQFNAFLSQDCDGCDCILAAACDNATIISNPDDRTRDCTAFNSGGELVRISRGYTDRSLATQTEFADIPASDLTKVVPGDTLLVSTYIEVDNADLISGYNSLLTIDLRYVEGDNAGSQLDVMRPDMSLARVQSLILKRQDGTVIDLGAIDFPGNPADNVRATSGASVLRSQYNGGLVDMTVDNPGITGDGYSEHFEAQNASTDRVDGVIHYVRYRNPCPEDPADDNDQAGLDIFKSVVGEFRDGDSICAVYQVPIVCTPEFLANDATRPTLRFGQSFSGSFEGNATVWNFTPGSCGLTSLAGTSPRRNINFTMVKPDVRQEARLEFINDCEAEYVYKLIVEDTTGMACFAEEYRPFIGIEDIELEIPSPYFVEEITLQHFDQPEIIVTPDSTVDMITSTVGGIDYLVPDGASGKVIFIDAEKADGVRALGYRDIDAGDDDITLVGGTFPLAGIGLASDGTNIDSLTFRVKLSRLCGSALQGTPITSTVNVSSNHLADYAVGAYRCNLDGFWYGGTGCGGANPVVYWPYRRTADLHPAHYFNNEELAATLIGDQPTVINATVALDPPGPILDLAGTEIVTYTIETSDMPEGGYLSICVEDAVDVVSIGGSAPIEVASTDSTTTYFYDLAAAFGSPLPTGPLDVEIETDLLFCAEAQICIKPFLGCSADLPDGYDAELATAVGAGAAVTCDELETLCYIYQAGRPAVDIDFSINNRQPLCATTMQTIRVRNTGTSPLGQINPTLYLPMGYVATDYMASIAGMTPVAIPDPTENTDLTGVYGIAYMWPVGTFPDIDIDETLIITFQGMTTCSYVSGSPLAFSLTGSAACQVMFEDDPVISEGLEVGGLGDLQPAFTFETGELQLTCTDQLDVTLTAINTGKSGVSDSRLCITLPPGVSLITDSLEFIAPLGATVDDLMVNDLGTGGATEVSLAAPDAGTGGFFCVRLVLEANIECGPVDIGLSVKRTETLECPGDPDSPCDILVLTAPDAFITIDVVPPVAGGEGNLTAACSETSDDLVLEYELEVINPTSVVYSDDVVIDVFYDLDETGDVSDPDSLLATATESLTLAGGASAILEGSTEVSPDVACPLVARISVPGCVCSEIIFPFENVLPDFIDDLGTDIVLCPGENFIIEDVCGDYTFEFVPSGAGNAELVGDNIEISVNPGFGIESPATLIATSRVGECGEQMTRINVTQRIDFEFGPYNFTVCEEGCTQVDFGIDINQLEDLEVLITPSLFLDDPTSLEPVICDPTSETIYELTFTLNDQCVFETTMLVDIDEQPEVMITPVTGCVDGVDLESAATIVPSTLDGEWSTAGDGSFEGGTRYSTATRYIPGPVDLALGSVRLTLRSDLPDSECGGDVARAEFTVLLVDCGTAPWDGVTPPDLAPPSDKSEDK